MIFVESKRKSLKNLSKKYPKGIILDITSKGEEPFVRFSPFFPHGKIPIPFSPNRYSMSVEGVWQGLKVFQGQDVDEDKFLIDNMKNIKRSTRKHGKILGHRKGIGGHELLDYKIARRKIYLETYAWVLDNLLKDLIYELKELACKQNLILLDYETNPDINNLSKPLSHAVLIKRYIEKKFPEIKDIKFEKEFYREKEIEIKDEQVAKKPNSKNQRVKKSRKKKSTNENQYSIF